MKRRLMIAVFPFLAVGGLLICALLLGELLRVIAQNQNQGQENRNAPQGSPKRPGQSQSVNNNAAGINRQTFQVTAVALRADNPSPTGPCPLDVVFHGSITTNGAGTVTYVFEGSDGSRSDVQTLSFRSAGTQRVTTNWTARGALRSPYLGSETIRILSPNELQSSSKMGSFTLTCENRQAGGGGNQSGEFRVVLNGFTVNNESDDDVLEGDGRGDEIFITSDALMVNRDGTDSPTRRVQTKVMGDPNGHPERVPAGTKSPGPLNTNLEAVIGGLQTGDVFPTLPPWRRVREIRTDRPPIVLWQGILTFGQNMVMIAPIIWEWDSDDLSASQQSVNRGLPRWFEDSKSNLLRYIGIVLPSDPLTHFAYPIRLDGKAGTRPIGYKEAGTRSELPAADTSHDYLEINGLFLTYDSAVKAADRVNLGVRGLNEIRYRDAHDHGDYTLYLQVERLDRH
jgi:hypothetical protein